ncbi:MAG: hypothetical protein U0270_07660 [Labilithrix sp.]
MKAPQTSTEIATALDSARARLDALQKEPDDAAWLASETQRNALERELRELGQLHARALEREGKARRESLEKTVAEQGAIVKAPFDAFARLTKHVVESGVVAAKLIDELYADERTRSIAHQAMSRAEEELGRVPRNPPLQFFPSLQHIREALWSALSDAGALTGGAHLSGIYQPIAPIPQTSATARDAANRGPSTYRAPGQYLDVFDEAGE